MFFMGHAINTRGRAVGHSILSFCNWLAFTNGRADEFGVSIPFLLQQSAWLYEKELQEVRAQMHRVKKSLKANNGGHSTHSDGTYALVDVLLLNVS
jgi:hypothetical protein